MAELNSFLTGIADAIRSKKGTTDKINASNFASEILSISGGGGSGSSEIIEVDELPTENIQEDVIYRVNEYIDKKVFFHTYYDSLPFTLEELLSSVNPDVKIEYYVVKNLPENPKQSDFTTFTEINVYIYNDISYVYTDFGSGISWLELNIVFNALYTQGTGVEVNLDNKGYIYNEEKLIDHGRDLELGVYVTYKEVIGVKINEKQSLYSYDIDWQDNQKVLDGTVTNFANSKLYFQIRQYQFLDCKELINVNLPNTRVIAKGGFHNCIKLTTVYLPKCRLLSEISFGNCESLKDIYLGYKDGVVEINKYFYGNIIPSTSIKIHVRSEYADQYATATNWQTLIDNGTVVIVGDYTD